MARLSAVLVPLLLAGCSGMKLDYAWDDARVLCSLPIDDQSPARVDLDDLIQEAAADGTVALVHAHAPGVTISMDAIEHVLWTAQSQGLELVTYDQLVPGHPRAALALAFDDAYPVEWYSLRPLLERYGARVTLFVTRFSQWSDDSKALLQQLAADGNDIEAHGVNHTNAEKYLSAHTAHDYLVDEIEPSIDILRAEGYPVTTFAFPFGASTDELDTEALTAIHRVRVGLHSCRQ